MQEELYVYRADLKRLLISKIKADRITDASVFHNGRRHRWETMGVKYCRSWGEAFDFLRNRAEQDIKYIDITTAAAALDSGKPETLDNLVGAVVMAAHEADFTADETISALETAKAVIIEETM